jgi:hypothetical protein
VSGSMLGSLGRLFAGRATRATTAADGPRARDDPTAHGPIEDWFVRTTRKLLTKARQSAAPAPSQVSPLQQRIAALEADNARLRADNERLADELRVLRTPAGVRPRHGRA